MARSTFGCLLVGAILGTLVVGWVLHRLTSGPIDPSGT
jgi:hypothetical protein